MVFLPGRGEINKLKAELRTKIQVELKNELVLSLGRAPESEDVAIYVESLHGDMDPQDLSLRTQTSRLNGIGKIFLSTSVGETSLTIPGVYVISLNSVWCLSQMVLCVLLIHIVLLFHGNNRQIEPVARKVAMLFS